MSNNQTNSSGRNNSSSNGNKSSSGSKNIHTTSLSDCIDIETVWTPIPELRHPKSIFECHFSLFFTERSHPDDIYLTHRSA